MEGHCSTVGYSANGRREINFGCNTLRTIELMCCGEVVLGLFKEFDTLNILSLLVR